ncbi:polyisoprenoid-binding protein YceI [Pontibacter ummariensis]|uniref:Polyisoprenoid-binding protein YceI n=1 Tax=Pontibacter ummariensis TaxID=1610492 RepID=A0A239LD20_9BACT|nr:YceI family protein [Pontibacter ummariensis]PRY03940.1 polyisoprenoid-binding protein YceI [Pontibacter ummariensis]SNT27539.1 Polyisoprenoid-binding protein YceI [Pontibacter ummariensis]
MKKSYLSLAVLSVALCFTSCDEVAINKATFALDEELSVVEWKGYSPTVYHHGAFAVESQGIEVVDGKVKGGVFSIPIATIQNFDLPDEMKPVLLEHLKSPDFFNIALHPSATFKITNVKSLDAPVNGATEGANYTVTGDFTMLGQTHAITFPAQIETDSGGLRILADFQLDRTMWGMNYAADPALGEHHILPKVDIKLNLVAHKE